MKARMRYLPGTQNAARWPSWVPVESVELAQEIAARSPNAWEIEEVRPPEADAGAAIQGELR